MCNRSHSFLHPYLIFLFNFMPSTSPLCLECFLLFPCFHFRSVSFSLGCMCVCVCVSIYHIFLHRTLNLKCNPFLLKTKVFIQKQLTTAKKTTFAFALSLHSNAHNNKWWIYYSAKCVASYVLGFSSLLLSQQASASMHWKFNWMCVEH